MLRFFCVSVLFTGFILPFLSAADREIVSGELGRHIDDYISVFENAGRFSGVVYVVRKSEPVIKKAYGKADYQLDVPNKTEYKFRIASLSKAFTATAVMQLKEKGLLDTSDKISKYLPEFKNWEKVSIRDLLMMTSGIPDFCESPDFIYSVARTRRTPMELLALEKNAPLDFEPGTKYAYSNINYTILGVIVEQISGMKFRDYLRKNILEPASMKSTGIESSVEITDGLVSPYRLGYFNNLEKALFIDMSVPFAAGDMYSTVSDLYIWDRTMLGEKLLSKKSLDEMLTPGSIPMGSEKNAFFCYGWVLRNTEYGKVYCYEGGIFGGSSIIVRFVEKDVCIVILSNIEELPLQEMSNAISLMLEGKRAEFPIFPKVVKLSEQQLRPNVGKYKLENGSIIEVLLKDGCLFLKSGRMEQPVFPESPSKFHVKSDLRAVLIFNNSANPSEIILKRDSSETKGVRISDGK